MDYPVPDNCLVVIVWLREEQLFSIPPTGQRAAVINAATTQKTRLLLRKERAIILLQHLAQNMSIFFGNAANRYMCASYPVFSIVHQ